MMNIFMSLQRHLVRRTNLLLGTSSNTSLEVTQPVPVLDPTQLLSLNCFVLGDDLKKAFTVKIPKTENVSILKKLIKEKKAPHLDHHAASDLDLWKVDLPLDNDTKETLKNINNLESLKSAREFGEELEPMVSVLTVFPDQPPLDRLHIVVRKPDISE
jgi:Crinkler effector protein N-terminal domain